MNTTSLPPPPLTLTTIFLFSPALSSSPGLPICSPNQVAHKKRMWWGRGGGGGREGKGQGGGGGGETVASLEQRITVKQVKDKIVMSSFGLPVITTLTGMCAWGRCYIRICAHYTVTGCALVCRYVSEVIYMYCLFCLLLSL